MNGVRWKIASDDLRCYIRCYGHRETCPETMPVARPLPASPDILLVFYFREPYTVQFCETGVEELVPANVIVGPQTYCRTRIVARGPFESFSIHFQPAGFHHLFGIDMTELTNCAWEARSVLGRKIDFLEQCLRKASDFDCRVQISEQFLRREAAAASRPDGVSAAARRIIREGGSHRIGEIAAGAGLSERQFERRFLRQVGIMPKLYSRIARFHQALEGKIAAPARNWADVASESGYFDQMHLLRDFRSLAGESPVSFLSRLQRLPADWVLTRPEW
jgi:AraC-like DNA-binding protein